MLMIIVLMVILPQSSFARGGSGYAVLDGETGRVLIGSNSNERLPIASLTKIWTALVAIENSDLQEEVVISPKAAMAEGSSIYLQAGETVTVETLLYGLMLRSGNDAATALAEHVGGSVEGFVKLMNERAVIAGLTNTVFMNPSGLHHEEHLSSARDTAEMLRVALQNKTFEKIASTVLYKANTVNGMLWENKHRLLREGSGMAAEIDDETEQPVSSLKSATGVAYAGKTGFTKVAGRTLATAFQKDGQTCIVVTLNESDDWNVHRSFSNQVWRDYDLETVVKKGKYNVNKKLAIRLEEPVRLQLNKEEKEQVRQVLHVSRKRQEAVLSIFLGEERIYAIPVKVESADR
ncbi:D-alanyl-D-alanine carboxypeptidase family protein [Lysinibacillus sp. fkY74-1]|uniref:Penicillin-binding protein 5* (D-alanyl-D-alanine carboxypeptidase) n=3 Tax=Lysinibacillus TaxID=400634 RepID=B1HRN2_LYSSC|nr:serine hydrolase [Lysinibacillus sphaericus]ACA39317.1 Penicillin-binding protein 5* precursor (D-alanyl-D-alanine carboxypeptidase) [Lysinibacillus sphaericus C3-41]EWH34778.1 DacB [Lysinibacillus sphaericus CBAM5]MBE5085298.1 D-alanyl-D-alanine carboxypeptidase [Bacillus thuringiensis]MBG9724925.1 D-alanyl-D-alanine carboxypeptidase [Lysinibacillus fusiformis]MBG9690922.1 D-alanyl-D-alanine carboxypeptidase [Lysinibacillus sphaericus]